MLSTAFLLTFAAIAAVTDLLEQKIYNRTVYPGIVTAFIVKTWEGGASGLEDSAKGFFVCGLLMVVCFALFKIGGGDVKLIAMIGAFLGLERGLEAMHWTFVIGAIAGLILLIWRVGFLKLVAHTVRHLALSLRAATWLPLSDEERRELQPPLFLSPAAACAVTIVSFDLIHYW